jgi:hypothetical protein
MTRFHNKRQKTSPEEVCENERLLCSKHLTHTLALLKQNHVIRHNSPLVGVSSQRLQLKIVTASVLVVLK